MSPSIPLAAHPDAVDGRGEAGTALCEACALGPGFTVPAEEVTLALIDNETGTVLRAPSAATAMTSAAAGSAHARPWSARTVPTTVTPASAPPVSDSHPSATSAWLGMRRPRRRLTIDRAGSTTADAAATAMPIAVWPTGRESMSWWLRHDGGRADRGQGVVEPVGGTRDAAGGGPACGSP